MTHKEYIELCNLERARAAEDCLRRIMDPPIAIQKLIVGLNLWSDQLQTKVLSTISGIKKEKR